MARSKHSTNFLNLFDGETLDGWKMAGKGNFIILQKENALQHKEEWVYYGITKRKASSKEDNSGIFVRFPNPRNDPYVAVTNGYEIQIDDLARPNGNLIHGTGAVYNFAAPYTINSKSIGELSQYITTTSYSV